MKNFKYYIIPIDGYDAKTTLQSLEKVLGKAAEIEILKSNDISQVLSTPSMNNYDNAYSVCMTSDYVCDKSPEPLVKMFDEKNPFIYSSDEKLYIIDMAHNKCKKYFNESNIHTGHIKTYLNFNLSSAHLYKEVADFDKYFTKRGKDIQKQRDSELRLSKEDAEKLKQVVKSSKKINTPVKKKR